MARRTRSFLFDNISKRLVQNTNKTAKEINTRRVANTVANTDILTSSETDTKISTTISNTGINTLSDISIANVVSDQVLQYNANTGNWENETLSLVSSVDGLTDTNLTSLSNGDYLVYSSSGSEWINRSLDLSSYVTDTDIAAYSNTAQMNTAIASSNTALKSYVDTNFSNTAQMNTAIASSNTAMKNYVDAEVAGVVNSAPSTLDTLNELAAALGDDPDFATTTATNIGTKLAKSSNLSDLTNAATARTNLGLGTAATTASTDYATSAQGTKADTAHSWGNHASAGYGTSNFSGAYADLTGKPSLFSGAYADLTGKPTIPTNNNQLTNGAGYITTTSANNSLVQLGAIQLYNNEKTTYTAAQGLLIYDQAGDNCLNIYNDNLSRWVKIWDDSNDGASSGLDADLLDGQHGSYYSNYNNLSNRPTIPTNNNQLTNGAGYITSTVSGDIDIVGDVKAAGQIRATGWWNTNSSDRSGYAVEIGWSAGEGYLLAYSRTAGAYGAMNYTATSHDFYSGNVRLKAGKYLDLESSAGNVRGYIQATDTNDQHLIIATTGGEDIAFKDGGLSGDSNLIIRGDGNVWVRGSILNGTMAYSQLTGTPTIPTNNNQLTNGAGYITNSGGTEAATASTVAKRNSSGDINARLFRSSYANQSTISGAIAYRVNTSDNYIRFCSDGAAIRSFIGAGTSSFSGSYNDLSNKPTIPTNNNQLTNGAGYITSSSLSAYARSNAAWTSAAAWKQTFHSGSGGATFGSNHYSMGVDVANGGWNSPNYSDLIIGYHTGIRIGGGYSGIRFYNNSPTTDANNDGNGDGGESLLMTIGGGGTSTSGANVTINNDLYMGDNVHVNSQKGFVTSGAWIRNKTAHGYIDIGPANSGHAHIYTDRSNFYFNKTNIQANGNAMWHAGNDGSGSGLDADTLDGLQLNSSTVNNQVNAVVRTQANGYIHAGWINSISGSSGTSSRLTRITASHDAYLRYLDPASFKVQIGESYKNNYSRSVDYSTDTNYWVGSFGHASYNANQTFHAGSGFFDIWSGSNYPSGTSHIHGFNALHYTVGSISGNTGNAYGWQMCAQYNQDSGPWWRRCSAGTFTSWRKIWHDSNDGSGSGLDADLLDGYHLTSQDRNNQANRVVRTEASGRIYGGQFWANDWFRPEGTSGLYFQSYGGGWHMTDSTWIRAYNGKAVYATNTIATSANICAYYSDERLKTITGHIDNALDKVLSLDGFYYVENELAKELGYNNDKQQVGVSAQKVQAVLPEAVELAPVDYETDEHDGTITSKSGENYLTVDYAKMVPLLIEAIKEQQKQIEELKEKLG